MPSITPFLWFNNNLEEAMKFYTSVFKDSKIVDVMRAGDQVFGATFELQGQRFQGLNGGPMFKFTEAISFFVSCDSQKEVDEYWEKLLAGGGEPSKCGWLKDRFGLSWQVIPRQLGEYLGSKDPAAAGRAQEAMMNMSKIDIAALKKAHDGK